MTQSLKIAFMGTPEFSCPTLQALINSDHEVVQVYSQPPKPVGRGHRVQNTPIHQLAEKHGLAVHTPKSLRKPEEHEYLRALNPDVVVVIAYGLILPKEILDIPNYGCINVHASILPRWRGAAPIQRCLMAGDQQSGTTIMVMDEGLDTGPTLCSESFDLTADMTASQLHDKLSLQGAKLLVPAMEGYVNGVLHPMPQPEDGVTYAHKLAKEDGRLDWAKPAEELERQVRALTPWPGTWFEHQGEKIKVQAAEVVENDSDLYPGEIAEDALTVGCGGKALNILTIQKPGSKPMDAESFLRGNKLSSPLG